MTAWGYALRQYGNDEGKELEGAGKTEALATLRVVTLKSWRQTDG